MTITDEILKIETPYYIGDKKMKYQIYFPEKENEAIRNDTAYIVKYMGEFELYKFHYFKNSEETCLVRIMSNANMDQVKQYAKIYNYNIENGNKLPEFWEAVH